MFLRPVAMWGDGKAAPRAPRRGVRARCPSPKPCPARSMDVR